MFPTFAPQVLPQIPSHVTPKPRTDTSAQAEPLLVHQEFADPSPPFGKELQNRSESPAETVCSVAAGCASAAHLLHSLARSPNSGVVLSRSPPQFSLYPPASVFFSYPLHLLPPSSSEVGPDGRGHNFLSARVHTNRRRTEPDFPPKANHCGPESSPEVVTRESES